MLTTFTIIRDIADVLMERVPRGLCIKTINDDLSRVRGSRRPSRAGEGRGGRAVHQGHQQ